MKLEVWYLSQLNVKPGDVVEWYYKDSHTGKLINSQCKYEVDVLDDGTVVDKLDGKGLSLFKGWRIVSRAKEVTSPVRAVNRKEIVPGVYGRVAVGGMKNGNIAVGLLDDSRLYDLTAFLDVVELRATAATLLEIADALDYNDGVCSDD